MRRICSVWADGTVSIRTVAKELVEAFMGSGGIFRLEDVGREIAKCLIKSREDSIAFKRDGWAAFLEPRIGTPEEMIHRRFVMAGVNGGLTEDEVYQLIADRDCPAMNDVGVACTDIHQLDSADLPQSRVFRDEWECIGGKVNPNMPKARLKHMNRLRPVRNDELEKESGSKYRLPPAIEALLPTETKTKLQRLRDIPQTFDLEQYTTPEALQEAWPDDIPVPATTLATTWAKHIKR